MKRSTRSSTRTAATAKATAVNSPAVADTTHAIISGSDNTARAARRASTRQEAAAEAEAVISADSPHHFAKSLDGFLGLNRSKRQEKFERGEKLLKIMTAQTGVKITKGSSDMLKLLIGTGDLTLLHIPWEYACGEKKGQEMEEEELQKMWKRFNQTMHTDFNISRHMLSATPHPSYSNLLLSRLAEEFPDILLRIDNIGKRMNKNIEITNSAAFHYLEGVREGNKDYQGGSKTHEDFQPWSDSDYRATDQVGNPPDGSDKTLTFYVQGCGKIQSTSHRHNDRCVKDSVTITQPHSVVVIMTKRCCGNGLGHVLHSSKGGGGTSLILTDYKWEGPRPAALKRLEEKIEQDSLTAKSEEEEDSKPSAKPKRSRRTAALKSEEP